MRLADKQRLLETLDVGERLEMLIGLVDGEIDVQQIEKRIRGRVKSQMEKSQREYYLNEQMKAIQKELGDLDEAPNELEELAKKIAAAGMPKAVETKAKTELNKLKQMSPMSAEATVVRNYLDWLLGVPWKKRTKVRKDLKAAQEVLDADHYGLEKVKERILEYLAVQARVKQMKGPILCLVGPPGVGKTSLGQSIAKATNRKFVRMSLGGVRDEAEIRGHRRTYIGSMPGRIVQNLNKVGSKNPLFVLDEIDKMSMDFRGDPSSALLEVLDPEQNHTFNDHYLEVDLDLSEVMFVATVQLAEHSRPVARPHGSDPHPRLHRGRKAQHRRALPAAQAAQGQRPEGGRAEDRRKRACATSCATTRANPACATSSARSPRSAARWSRKSRSPGRSRRRRRRAARHATCSVDSEEPGEVPGRAALRFRSRGSARTRVGLVTGLAWTEVGGDLLQIEATLVPGKGQLILTGQLGDVMQESVKAALQRGARAQRAPGPRSRVPPEIRHPRARARGRDAQGRPERRHRHGHRAGVGAVQACRCAPMSR